MCTNFVEPLPYQPPIPHQTFADTVSLAQVRNVRPRPAEPNVANVPPIRNVRQRPADPIVHQPELSLMQRVNQANAIQAQQRNDLQRDRLRTIRAPPIYLSLNEKFYHIFVALLMFFIQLL